jgi:N-acetylglucosaminyldiphosphoundecaprenol N-acetyl-beta-D-mannosaminyltransferase
VAKLVRSEYTWGYSKFSDHEMKSAQQNAQKVNILGVQVDTYRLSGLLDLIRSTISAQQHLLITHTHVRGLHLAYEKPWFRDFLNQSDIVYCDGMGVKLAARLLGYHIPERYTLADWYDQLIELAYQNGFSFYFLGNPPGVADLAVQKLKTAYPGLKITGTHHGFFDQSGGSLENKLIAAEINAQKPNILLVGLGMPAQEKWLRDHWDQLKPGVNVAITCGAIFEYMAGTLKHGPDWMTQHYMEWLFRLFDRPDRYAKRYFRDNPLLLVRVLRQKLIGLPF